MRTARTGPSRARQAGAAGSVQEVLGIEQPVLLAGMGGVSGAGLASAVATAGGLGVIGAYKAVGPALGGMLDELADTACGRVGVNVIPEVAGPERLAAQIDQILRESPRRVAITTFGLLPCALAGRVKQAGRTLIEQVGTVADATAALRGGADAVIIQGIEAGGHLLGSAPAAALVRAARRRHPHACVIAAGGVATAADSAAMMRAGASGVCCGTAFVPVTESRAHQVYKERVIRATAADTVVTGVFEIGWPGRRHRVLASSLTAAPERFARGFIATMTLDGVSHPVCRFSAAVPTVFTRGRVEEMAMYAGLSCGGVTQARPAAAVVAALAAGFEEDD